MKNGKLLILICFIFNICLSAYSYEDCIITTNGKMTDIKIQHNDIIDVFPLTTIMNEKNTLIVHPLKTGNTKFSILKNNKDKFIFDVKVTKDKTEINNVVGFEIYTLDCPPEDEYLELDEPPAPFDLDEPPAMQNIKNE